MYTKIIFDDSDDILKNPKDTEPDSGKSCRKRRATIKNIGISIDESILAIETFFSNNNEKIPKTISKELKKLMVARTDLSKLNIKRKNKKQEKPYNFQIPKKITKNLSSFSGWKMGSMKSRVEVTNYLCQYIKDQDLSIRNNDGKKIIKMDKKLKDLFNINDGEITYKDIQSKLESLFQKRSQNSKHLPQKKDL